MKDPALERERAANPARYWNSRRGEPRQRCEVCQCQLSSTTSWNTVVEMPPGAAFDYTTVVTCLSHYCRFRASDSWKRHPTQARYTGDGDDRGRRQH